MTTQAYIPTEEELKEIGFRKFISGEFCLQNLDIFNIEFSHGKFRLFTYSEDCDGVSTYIYPTDKAHLQSIILAFQPQ